MATTDARLASAVLDVFLDAGVEFAVLHNEDTIAAGHAPSDLDLVVGTDPKATMRRVLSPLIQVGLRPILLWDYDVGGTCTVFLATDCARDGVQLDLMFDPKGWGKYGVRTTAMLEGRTQGERWPTVDPLRGLAYSIRKRHVKEDWTRLQDLVTEARSLPAEALQPVLRDTFEPRIAASLRSIISGTARPGSIPYPGNYRWRNTARHVLRLRRPIGFWVAVDGAPTNELLTGVAYRFGRFLPMSAASARPSVLIEQIGWWMNDVAVIRWRPGLVISRNAGWLRADLCLPDAGSLDAICTQIVDAMNRRIEL